MQQVIFLLVAAGIGLVIFKIRGDAARDRKSVMARLDAERAERGDYSPTAELFREVGVTPPPTFERLSDIGSSPPVPTFADGTYVDPSYADPPVGAPDLDAPPPVAAEITNDLGAREPVAPEPFAPEPAATAEPAPAGDLRTLFKGIAMPARLKPLGPLVPVTASFVTDASPAEVHAGLEAEFERLDCAARWVEPTVAQTERNGMRGLVTIYPNPAGLTDLDGTPLFPGVAPGQVVVKMLAL